MIKRWLVYAGVFGLAGAQAQMQGFEGSADPAMVVYQIQAGDTLSQLSEKYFKQPANLELIRNLNHLRSVDLLPTGGSLKVPREFVKEGASLATVVSVSCARPIRVGASTKAMVVGATLAEGAVVDVPADCEVALLLEDSSMVRLPSGAAVKLAVLRKSAMQSSPEVQLELVRGRIDLEVNKGRSKTTPFEVRTPLAVAGVRGTEFRVGYTPDKHLGQVEVLGGTVAVAGVNDTQTQLVTKGQGVPIDASGKAMRVEPLLAAPLVERAEVVNRAQSTYVIKLSGSEQASHYMVQSAQRVNLLGAPHTQTLHSAELVTDGLSPEARFYKLSSVSHAGLVGEARQYGFCTVAAGSKAQHCRAVFEAPLSDGVRIDFSLMRQDTGATQELMSTNKLQARNGRFAVEGLPAGRYAWRMSYLTAQADVNAPSSVTQQFGHFDLIALPAGQP
jgi:hypothetical protein